MQTVISFSTYFKSLFAIALFLIMPISYAQTESPENCAQAQAGLAAAMGVFRSAYFERDETVGSAESVMDNQVKNSAENIYRLCPPETATVVKAGLQKASASLEDPKRAELVVCDKALSKYQTLLNKFDTVNLSGYDAYRSLLDRDVEPSAKAAIDACPQMPALAKQTQTDRIERQKRLDRMEDLEYARPTIAEDIETRNAEFTESFESSE